MARRARFRLLGDHWIAYGGGTIPEDRIIEVSEEEAADFLRHRGSARSVEFLEWVPDPATPHENRKQDPD
jgi:hypothetical protein